jgi:hypothetical protein
MRAARTSSTVPCEAVEASGEYDPTEPQPLRRRNLELAIERFPRALRPRPHVVLSAGLPLGTRA